MAASVQVLCPNGRRQTVKTTPNTKLLQILEEVCQRQGLGSPDDFKLVHGRKDLDLSLSWRFSSLPNNAKLELAKSVSARVEQDVTIALQLDSGERLQDSFSPSVDLWAILLHFEAKNEAAYKDVLTRVDSSQSPPLHPVCIFMREEVTGEAALKATTLRKLALTSGKAIIRLHHRPVDSELMSDIVGRVERDRQRQAKLEEIAQKKKQQSEAEALQASQAQVSQRTTSLTAVREDVDMNSEPSDMDVSEQPSSTTSGLPGPPRETTTSMDVVSSRGGGGGGATSQESAMDEGGTDLFPVVSTSRAAVENLRAIPGVEVFTPDEFHDLTPQEQQIARRLAERFMPHLQHQQLEAPQPNASAASASSQRQHKNRNDNMLVNFKFPEATKGLDLTSAHGLNADTTVPACDREAVCYSCDERLTESQTEELSDDFFELTTEDVKKMYRDLQEQVHRLEEAPLMTRALKQDQAEAAYDHYDRVVIRVQFPDRLVLQACFRPRETVSALHGFVRGHLHHQADRFYLYTSPPKTVLSAMSSSLAANNLAPAALVYFGSNTQRDHYLSESLRSHTAPRLQAEMAVSNVLKSSGSRPPASSEPAASSSGPVAGPSGVRRQAADRLGEASTSRVAGGAAGGSTLPSGAQVPKWLKLSKK